MKKLFFILVIFVTGQLAMHAQDTLCSGKALNFPFHRYGISIGNSCLFNGIRINFIDKNVRQINGINLTAFFSLRKNQQARVNGITLGILPAAYVMQPINIGLIGVGSMHCTRGITLGGILVGGDVIGLGVAGLGVFADGSRGIMRGMALGGLIVTAPNALSGISIGGLGVATEGNINGLAIAAAYMYSNYFIRGITITAGYLDANVYKGIALAGYSRSKRMMGISIALVNHTHDLKGLQIGILNIAENNTKGLRFLPFMNMHFGESSNPGL